MDGQQEPVRYKSNLLFGSESDSVPALFAYFLYWFRESKVADRAKHQVMKYQTAMMSVDELITSILILSIFW